MIKNNTTRLSVVASAIALALLSKTSNAVEIVSGNEMTNVILTGSDFEWSGSGTTAKVGVDNLYNYWDANPGSYVRVISGTTVSTDINLGVNGGRNLGLEGLSTFDVYGNITGSVVSGEGGSLNIGANFLDSYSGVTAVFLGSTSRQGSFQELDSINVNAQVLQIERGSSVTLGEGDSLKLARSWFDLSTNTFVADLPDNTAFVNDGRVEQLGANSLVDIRGIFMNDYQYVLQGGALKIKNDAYIRGQGTFDQSAGTTNTVKGDLIIQDLATYNMYGGQLNADSISSGSSYSSTYISDGVDINGEQRWILTGVDIGEADGRFNYVDGAVRMKGDLYIRAGGLLGQDIVMDAGELFGAKNMYLGTLDDSLTDFGGQGVGALASGSITMNGGFNRVVEDMVIGEQATMTQNGGLNDIGGNLYIDGGSYTQNSGGNTIAGSLWLGDGGQYTMNGGQLNVGEIMSSGNTTGYCQQVALGAGYIAGNNCDQLGTPLTTVSASINYINGGIRLTNSNLSVSQNGVLGNSLLIDEANETFGAVNMTVGTATTTNGGSINQSTGQNLIRNILRIEANGDYSLSGGRLEFGSFTGPGKINFTGGGIYSGSDITIGTSGSVGSSLTLSSGMTLSAQKTWRDPRNNVVIDAGADLVLDGGELIASGIVRNGTFNYVSGLLDLNNLTIGSNGLFGSLTLTGSQRLYVRDNITIEAGATFEIGSLPGGSSAIYGNATITNSGGLVLNNGSLDASQINNVGAGSFIFNRGSLSLASLNIGNTGLLGQTVSLDASRNINAGNLNIEAGSRLEITGGSSRATNLTNQGVVVVGASGQLSGNTYVQDQAVAVTTVDGVLSANVVISDGQLNGSGTITGSLSNAGNFNPGNSPGLLSVNGDFTQSANGTLTIELGGLLSGSEFDIVDVGGTANLAGTLNLDLFDLGGGPFTPGLGDTFDFLTAETITGGFDLLTLAALGNGLGWQLDYLYDEIGTIDVARMTVVSVSAVPVPAAVWLFGSGLIGLIGMAKRKARA